MKQDFRHTAQTQEESLLANARASEGLLAHARTSANDLISFKTEII